MRPSATPESVLRHLFQACRTNDDVEKILASPLLDINGIKDGVWSDDQNDLLTGVTPLHVSCKYWVKRNVLSLLKAGADPNVNSDGMTTPLMFAVIFHNRDAVHYLMEHGADLNATNVDGFTALSLACVEGREAMAKILVGAGADLEVPSKKYGGFTALQYAIKWKEFGIARLLVEAGADTSTLNKGGRVFSTKIGV